MEQQGSDFYDRMHAELDREANRDRYQPLFERIIANIQDHGSRAILEVGCGSGFLAEIILRQHHGTYHGFDFSSQAIRNAGARTGCPEVFSVSGALDTESYACEYDTIVCTEMLEHVDGDLDVIRLWRNGAWCVCSVPNFDYAGHVRFFKSSDEVAARYGGLIDIKAVIKIARPISIKSYLRHLRWSWNNPSELIGLLGIQMFARLGGWFLFYGTKRNEFAGTENAVVR
jgi:cyclopropane fatty-acyl-phospholipid synthase-like methyltransferase